MPIATNKIEGEKSISTSAALHIVNDPTSLLVDEVLLSFELFVRLFPTSKADRTSQPDSLRFVLLKFVGVPDYFNSFKIFKVSGIDNSSNNTSCVTITNHSNLIKFGHQFTVDKCVVQSISIDSIPILEKVFVAVPPTVYNILHTSPSDSVRSQFVSKLLSENGGVVSENDIIRSINGVAALCEPVLQGLVKGSTDIIFVKKNEFEEASFIDDNQEVADENIDLSQYLSSTLELDQDKHEPEYPKFEVRPLPHDMSVSSRNSRHEDHELYIFINNRDIPSLGFPVFNGDLVKISSGDASIVVKLFTLVEPNKSFSCGNLYLSPMLIINLNLNDRCEVTLKPCHSSSQNFSDIFPIAKTATISRVASPITMDRSYQQSFLSELKESFHSYLKVVRPGDFLPICIDSVLAKALFDVSLSQQLNSNEEIDSDANIIPKGNPDSVAWFKIIELSGDGSSNSSQQFLIDPLQTALTSSGVEFIASPANKYSNWVDYLNLPPVFNYRTSFEDGSIFSYAQEFYRIITTDMSTCRKVDLKTTILLNSMSRGLGKTTLVRSLAIDLGLNLIELDAFDFIKPGAELKSIGLLTGKIEKQLMGQPEDLSIYHILYIKHIENLCVQSDENEQGANLSTSLSLKVVQTLQDCLARYRNMVLVVSCNNIDKLSANLRQIVKFQIDVSVPSEKERLEIFKYLLDIETRVLNNEMIPDAYEDRVEFEDKLDINKVQIDMRGDVSYQSLALQSAGLTPRDLSSIIRKAKQFAIKRLFKLAKNSHIELKKIIKVGNGGHVVLIPEDFEQAINEARNQFSDSIGAPRIPNVKWEDIGGLDLVKDEILDTIDLPLKHPELFSSGLKKRSGILFYGPPGTGKTLLAKAIATNFSLNFFSVKGPELLNMYIGESEANVRRVFQRARDAKPCVIFFDELDSVAPKRGNQGDSGGVMDRIVSQLLAELDGMSGGDSGEGVFVVGATNRPDLLDEALLRPGRFDKMLYLGISDTNEKQTKILEALSRKFQLSDDVDLAEISQRCSFTYTGADFYALCSDAMLNAMTRTANEVDNKIRLFNEARLSEEKEPVSSRWWFDNVAGADDIKVLVTMQDFSKSQSEIVPSVSAEELAHYLRVKENFEGGKSNPQQNGNNAEFERLESLSQSFEASLSNGHGQNLEAGFSNGHTT